MEVFVISIAALGVVVIAYAYAFARQILEMHEDGVAERASPSSLSFWFPGGDRNVHPVHGQRRGDR